MKPRLLLLAFFAANLASAVASAPGGLVVKNRTPETFSVVLDRQRVAARVNSFQFSGLTPGRHRVHVAYDCFAYNFDLHNDVIYDAWIDFQPGETMTLDIQPNGLVHASSFIAPCAPVAAHRRLPAPVCPPKAAPVCNTPYIGYETFPAPLYGMDPDAFFSLRQTVLNRSFDSSKREMLAAALKSNRVTAAQLYELLNLLDFESSKVEIAKIGYASVVDKQNFFRVYDAFTFDSSIRELQGYTG